MKLTCPQCGFSREIPENRVPEGSVIAKCPKCSCRFRFSRAEGVGEIVPPKGWQKGPDEEEDIRVVASNAYAREARRFENELKATQDQHELPGNPWAHAPEPDGWLPAFYQTVTRVMFQAPLFFKNLEPQTQVWRPLLFFVVICVIQTLVERAWGDAIYSFFAGESDPQLQALLKLLAPAASLPLTVLLRTGALLLQLFVFALLMFFAYRLIAPSRTTFMLLYQILAYSSAPWLLCVIPGIGSLAGTVWSIGCLAVGCRTAMNLTWLQTCAGFLPLFAIIVPLLPQLARLLGQGM